MLTPLSAHSLFASRDMISRTIRPGASPSWQTRTTASVIGTSFPPSSVCASGFVCILVAVLSVPVPSAFCFCDAVVASSIGSAGSSSSESRRVE